MNKMEWNGQKLVVDGHRFVAATFTSAKSRPGRLVLWKDRPLIEALTAILDEGQPARIFEIGIARGGSTGFIGAYAPPQKLAAIDYSPEPVEPLTQFIKAAKLEGNIFPFYGVDQGDVGRLREIAAEVFAGEPLDLVIDDASHRLDKTRRSFETLFPLLRPGGVYAIEDWQWGLKPLPPEVRAADPKKWSYLATGQSLALLPMELVMAAAKGGVIESISVDRHFVKVVRGPGDLSDSFQLEDLYPREAKELLGSHAILENDSMENTTTVSNSGTTLDQRPKS